MANSISKGNSALKQRLETSLVKQMNLRPPVAINKTATVRDAVVAMRAAHLGCVVAVDDDNVAVGIFTEAMLRHALNESAAVLDAPLQEQMVARLPWVLPTDEVKMVLDAMEEHNIRFIAVLDEQRHVLGLTGQKTVMEFVAKSFTHGLSGADSMGNKIQTFEDPIEQMFHNETAANIQTQPLTCVEAGTSVRDTMKLMVGLQIACVLVKQDGRLVGIFGDRDVLDKVSLEYDKVIDTAVRNVMSDQPVYVQEVDSAAKTLAIMAESGHRHIPVVNAKHEPTGIVSPQRMATFLSAHL